MPLGTAENEDEDDWRSRRSHRQESSIDEQFINLFYILMDPFFDHEKIKPVREERATQKIGQIAVGPPGWLEKGLSASLLVRYVSQRIRSSLAPSIQTF